MTKRADRCLRRLFFLCLSESPPFVDHRFLTLITRHAWRPCISHIPRRRREEIRKIIVFLKNYDWLTTRQGNTTCVWHVFKNEWFYFFKMFVRSSLNFVRQIAFVARRHDFDFPQNSRTRCVYFLVFIE